MKYIFIIVALVVALASCKKDEILTVVEPEDYYPAYPGSVWYYSNGEVSKVHTEYVAHSYQPQLNSTAYTEKKLVPYIDHEYLYGYEITQNSNSYPLKKLLTETVGQPWVVDTVGSNYVKRQTIQKLDSMIINFSDAEGFADSTYFDVVVVIEFLASLDAAHFNRKEYYAKHIGLLQVEINDPFGTNIPVIQKKLVAYKINK